MGIESIVKFSSSKWGVCTCGHFDWEHSDFVYDLNHTPVGRGDGHGRCTHVMDLDHAPHEDNREHEEDMCECQQFTWAQTVLRDPSYGASGRRVR